MFEKVNIEGNTTFIDNRKGSDNLLHLLLLNQGLPYGVPITVGILHLVSINDCDIGTFLMIGKQMEISNLF
jgi:hypothetical protein